MITDVDRRHQAERDAIAASASRAATQVWGQLDEGDLSGSWQSLLVRVLEILAGAQATAAGSSNDWITASTGQPARHDVVPAAFAGVASDGRSLASLLLWPLITALTGIKRGQSTPQALGAGAAMLQLLTRTQVADAGRAADSVAMTVHPTVVGYERVVELPACGRCVILAGRLYRWSDGFQRHPQCDCTMSPVSDAEWQLGRPDNTPGNLFAQMSPEAQAKAFTVDGARAIRDGADPSQVVNARRGMTTATAYGQRIQATSEGTTRRGLYGGYEIREDGSLRRRADRELAKTPGSRYRRARTPRLMPGEIYARAADREDAVRLLTRFGYIR